MLIIVFLRTRVVPKAAEPATLLELKHPLYVLQERDGLISPLQTAQTFEDFFLYSNYTDLFGLEYNPLLDPYSPFFFRPENCMTANSFVLPQQPSPIIGVVGPANNVQNATVDYLTQVFNWQVKYEIQQLNFEFKYFDTVEDFNTYVQSDTYLKTDPGVCFGFMVTKNDAANYQANLFFDDYVYLGGLEATGMPNQWFPAFNPAITIPQLQDYKETSLYGYGYLQNLIANMILRETTGVETANIAMMTVPMIAETSNTESTDPFAYFIRWSIPGFLVLIYILPVYQLVYMIVKEKESRCKESMRMMGMSDISYWLSWFVHYTLINTVIATIAWLILLINVIQFSRPFYIWIYFWLYGEAVFGQILLIQSFLSKSKFSGIVATLFYFGCTFIAFPTQMDSASHSLKAALGILPQVAVYEMARVWSIYETNGVGITKFTVDQVIYGFSFQEGLILLICGLFLWALIGLYLDQVLPMDYGTRKHPCFPFQKKTYISCCGSGVEPDLDEESKNRLLDAKEFDELENPNQNFENVTSEIFRQEIEGKYLRIKNLNKTFSNGIQAVKDLNLRIYQNQIFALLGENGAGKSTTINILAGLISRTEGKALCYEKDMFEQATQVRSFMGVCQQQDVLFDFLTPEEHLDFFYELKGGEPTLKEREINDLLTDLQLTEIKTKVTTSLSGGNKRKVSVAIALCGKSTLVLLDEPTAGMDQNARRGLWDMLQNYRQDRIIVLTTQIMDEANVLGDRIGIMAQGSLKCLGSSQFLKNRFASGSKLTMTKFSIEKNKMIGPYLQQRLGQVFFQNEVSSEITFGIPQDVDLKDFFPNFEMNMSNLGILSYKMSITTLEDVFHTINNNYEQIGQRDSLLPTQMQGQMNTQTNSDQKNNEWSYFQEDNQLIHESSMANNVEALLTKRLKIYKRDKIGLICEILVPSLLVLIGASASMLEFYQNSPYRTLSTDLYPSQQRIVMNQANVIDSANGNISPQVLFNNLPTPDFWSVTWDTTSETFADFYDSVNEQRLIAPTIPCRYGSYQIYKADSNAMQFYINSYINTTSQDVTAAFPQFMYQSVLKTASSNPNFNFTVVNSPFPVLAVFKQRSVIANAFDFNFMVAVAIGLIATVMMTFIQKEKEGKLKHMQMISGMSLPAYWISNFVSDILKTYIPLVLIIFISMIFGCNYQGVAGMMMVLPLALVPFTYVTSFWFTNETPAQISTFFFHFFVCGILAPIVFGCQCIPSTFQLGDSMRWILLCICPTYAVSNAILWSAGGEIILEARSLDESLPQLPTNLWAIKNLGGDILVLFLQCLFMLTLLVLIEMGVFAKCSKLSFRSMQLRDHLLGLVKPEDVKQEEERVKRDEIIQDLSVVNLSKVYTSLFRQPQVAVELISFGLVNGESLALLGVNGAGKSSTLKCLTADTEFTRGEIRLQDYSGPQNFQRKFIGYCPQNNAVFSLMTVEEHLYFYAKLKGIVDSKKAELISKIMLDLNLTKHKSTLAGELSGGDRRKLSVAIAILGNPKLILLDEPSIGMDPEARINMWKVVSKILLNKKSKSLMIVSTNSIEEAQALSTKMAIMQNGIFRCFGSNQQIKNKIQGHEIEVKIRNINYQELQQLAAELGFEGAKLEDRMPLAKAQTLKVEKVILDQIMKKGLGAYLVAEADQNEGRVLLKNLMKFISVQGNAVKLVRSLLQLYSQVDLIEQCSDFFKFRIAAEGKTVGQLFYHIDQQYQMLIQDYSVCQTSFEQVFSAMTVESDKHLLSYKLTSQGNVVLVNRDSEQQVFDLLMEVSN